MGLDNISKFLWANKTTVPRITLPPSVIWEQNDKILDGDTALTVDDVLLRPYRGLVKSREDLTISNILYTAPMDTVTDIDIYCNAVGLGIIPVLSRVYLNDGLELGFDYLSRGFLSTGLEREEVNKVFSLVRQRELPYINIAIDIAHGWSLRGLNVIRMLREELGDKVNIMCGSIATGEAALELIDAGANILRVGIGGGQMCTTRLMTGCGVPNLTAVYDVHKTVYNKFGYELEVDKGNINYKRHVTIIADGGVRTPGDVTKYLCAGADGVMVGTAFAACVDSPAPVDDNGNKLHRGQASFAFQTERLGKLRNDCAEGVDRKLKTDGTFKDKVKWFHGGIRSAVSYVGGCRVEHLNPCNVRFVRVSPTALRESRPMD